MIYIIPMSKSVHSGICDKRIGFYLEVGLEIPQKNKTKGKFPKKISFQVVMELKKVQKQGRDEKSQEPYPIHYKQHRPSLWPPT